MKKIEPYQNIINANIENSNSNKRRREDCNEDEMIVKDEGVTILLGDSMRIDYQRNSIG